MGISRTTLTLGLIVGVFVITTLAWASPAFLKTFNDTYKVKPDSTLGKARCAVCHAEATKNYKKLNPYGLDMQKLLKQEKATKLTDKMLVKLQNLDSDKDKSSNIAEIKADRLPGDAKSCPKK